MLYCKVKLRFFFFFFFLAMLGLFCREGFSLVLEHGCCSLVAEHGVLIAVASRCRARALGCSGFSRCCPWTQSLHFLGSGTQAQWLWCTGLLGAPRNMGSLQTRNQTSNPCLLRWQVDSTAEPQGRP